MEKKTKTVAMETAKKNSKKAEAKDEKLSYEQLEQIAINLNQQCQQLQQQLHQAQQTIANFNGMEVVVSLLMDILGKSEFFSEDFIARCVNKIEFIASKAMDTVKDKQESQEQ
jgi:hypothetical protein